MQTTMIHVPHASVFIPPEYRSSFCAANLRHEIGVMTDWFCDELFDCVAERLVFPISRLVCDVERFRDDEREVMAKIGMGAVYESCSDLTPLRQIDAEEREEILRRYYDVHHKRLTDTVGERLIKPFHIFPPVLIFGVLL